MKELVRELVRFGVVGKPEWPRKAVYGRAGYEKGDEDAPFFTEAFLYNLIGKEDARELIGIVRKLCEATGLDFEDEVIAAERLG